MTEEWSDTALRMRALELATNIVSQYELTDNTTETMKVAKAFYDFLKGE